jgi:hypothetical protein
VGATNVTPFGTALARQASAAVISWLGKHALTNAGLVTNFLP